MREGPGESNIEIEFEKTWSRRWRAPAFRRRTWTRPGHPSGSLSALHCSSSSSSASAGSSPAATTGISSGPSAGPTLAKPIPWKIPSSLQQNLNPVVRYVNEKTLSNSRYSDHIACSSTLLNKRERHSSLTFSKLNFAEFTLSLIFFPFFPFLAGFGEESEPELAGANAGGCSPEIHSSAMPVRATEGGEVRPYSSEAAS